LVSWYPRNLEDIVSSLGKRYDIIWLRRGARALSPAMPSPTSSGGTAPSEGRTLDNVNHSENNVKLFSGIDPFKVFDVFHDTVRSLDRVIYGKFRRPLEKLREFGRRKLGADPYDLGFFPRETADYSF